MIDMIEFVFAVLVGLGLFLLIKTIEMGKGDKETIIYFFISLGLIIGGCYGLISVISIDVLMKKIGGILSTLIGFFLLFKFPGREGYGVEEFVNLGMLIGLVLLVIGIWLILF